ncbi:MAG: MFS transporter [Nitrososphaerales archaeon]|nr:MFS transporter [Nitrososphaerales archaeon]
MNYKWTVLTVTTVGVLMSGVDSRIVVIGLPSVAASLHADAEQAIWFTQAYSIGSTVALLFIGRVSDMFGRVKIYIVGFAAFTAGSLMTALSPAPDYFILARIIQGLGSASLFANSAAIITDAFPSGELGLALGINQIAFRAGSMAGLTISGLILSLLDWRYLFYVNIPIGIFGTLWAHRRLKEVGTIERGVPMDWTGFVTFTVFVSGLLMALSFAAYGTGQAALVAVLLLVAAVSIVAFVKAEHRTSHPLLDLRLLRIREYTGGLTAQFLNAVAFGAFTLIISLYLQLVQGLSPLQAGIAILPFDVSFLLTGPLSGRLSDRFGTMPFTTAGLAIVSLSLFLFSTVGPVTPYATLVIYLLICGAGMGFFASPNISSIMGSVPTHRRGVASGLRATFFNVGLTLSFNVVILVMTFYLPYSLITSVIASGNPSGIGVSARAIFSVGLDRVYLVLAFVNSFAIVPSLLRGKRQREQPGPAGNSNTTRASEEPND